MVVWTGRLRAPQTPRFRVEALAPSVMLCGYGPLGGHVGSMRPRGWAVVMELVALEREEDLSASTCMHQGKAM